MIDVGHIRRKCVLIFSQILKHVFDSAFLIQTMMSALSVTQSLKAWRRSTTRLTPSASTSWRTTTRTPPGSTTSTTPRLWFTSGGCRRSCLTETSWMERESWSGSHHRFQICCQFSIGQSKAMILLDQIYFWPGCVRDERRDWRSEQKTFGETSGWKRVCGGLLL